MIDSFLRSFGTDYRFIYFLSKKHDDSTVSIDDAGFDGSDDEEEV